MDFIDLVLGTIIAIAIYVAYEVWVDSRDVRDTEVSLAAPSHPRTYPLEAVVWQVQLLLDKGQTMEARGDARAYANMVLDTHVAGELQKLECEYLLLHRSCPEGSRMVSDALVMRYAEDFRRQHLAG